MNNEIAKLAVENLNHHTGIQALWKNGGPFDGALELTFNKTKYIFFAEVEREVRSHQIEKFAQIFQQNEQFLLLANRLFPKIKEELRERGVPYLEANGNIYLKNDSLFLFVDTHNPLKINKGISNRAFTSTGLKVVFFLLQYKEAIALTQRNLADKVGVGLGNIPQVIDGLKETGYLLPLNSKTYLWENRKDLLDRWIGQYAISLRPKLTRERYALKGDWQLVNFDRDTTVWGGEPAADLLTNHLRPEKFLIYTRENRMDLIRKYGLMPDINGPIEVLDMFWQFNEGATAPPLLVYADLMLEGGKRNRETAEKIFNEHVQPNL
jgi:hypothetical protein